MAATVRLVIVLFLLCSAGFACRRGGDTEPPVATPSVTLARPDAVVGGPLEMTYRFVMAPGAPALGDDYWVFVHFTDTDGELMWTDDHEPPTPARGWKAGQTIEYTRTMFVPRFPYVGETNIAIGLFSRESGARLPLQGETLGQREYKVGTFTLQLQGESLFIVFKDGWHPTEQAETGAREWQWSKKEATLAFRNPRRDAVFYLQVDRTDAFPEPQHVDVRIGEQTIDSFTLAPNQTELRKVPLTAAQLGAGDTVEVKMTVDRTFMPSLIPTLNSNDPRELGVRVFRAYVEAK